jgi:hypothetical protein
MILVVFVLFALILFFSILLASIHTSPQRVSQSRALLAVNEIVQLDSVSIKNANRIFDDAEYRMLKSNPALAAVASRLRKDRQEIALIWLSLLINDLRRLSRFRSFLVRGGVSTEMTDELGVFFTFVSSVLLLTVLKLFVRLFGPFVVHGIARHAKVSIEALSHASAKLLDRLPYSIWSDIAQNWRSHGFAS